MDSSFIAFDVRTHPRAAIVAAICARAAHVELAVHPPERLLHGLARDPQRQRNLDVVAARGGEARDLYLA